MNKITEEIRKQLRDPLPQQAISQHPTKPYLSSIKAIYVVERLNSVFGVGGWKVENEFVEKVNSMVVIKAKLTIPEYGVYVEHFGGNDNGGENSKNFDLGDAYKGACTDALTKIASYLEIGIDVFKGLSHNPQKTSEMPRTATQPQNTTQYPPNDKPWITEAEFEQAIKTMFDNGIIMIGTETKEVMKLLRMRYAVAKKYENKVQEEIIKNVNEPMFD